ncbi:hypothetical protein HRR83_002530 [Exophiala dermatitidis]|uniref:tRNA(Phe) 7-[(3-amino-3-carboxypropyl)-4-demethylwyosine(37)-N(4)]-methyltransferase n=1 Tax=Exophiala dermatitidis TaxID=5970 RepID=A0AAN6EVL0_EXODE|nr:hypothetical protein HRR74_002607 [Exophiala dermatitidis]KAJ4525320.1 hypothetical protein HRR73_002049 [Exophiala dermatitidis]KAJ4536631.1 hypothetical protein HRR76_004661 [Exophiala dermatitidis]KAJ4555768.1 hypothetical protein HRR77_001693 [Exophiala dermatitidis]KAJ4556104.1 hypothetical protein HRR78_001762 [Exophiala dermatitidis]
MPRLYSEPEIPPSFKAKKAKILSLLGQSDEAYTDKSPKGTVDAQIRELIAEINAYDGLVTTSSCAGRVAVFVEGPKRKPKPEPEILEVRVGNGEPINGAKGHADDGVSTGRSTGTTTASPGGKGGGRWLYVSHDPIPTPKSNLKASEQPAVNPTSTEAVHSEPLVQHDAEYFTSLFKLSSPQQTELPQASPSNNNVAPLLKGVGASSNPRLVHLSFSPLILHILCATLHHARVLLAAAINAGFRESGVQSLRAMDEPEHGVMVAVRTAGLGFETVVGVVSGDQDTANLEGRESVHKLVDENYLAVCAGVVNERFRWNDERRERFRAELRKAVVSTTAAASSAAAPCGTEDTAAPATRPESRWEDKDERRRRKREEGLKRQKEAEKMKNQQQQLLETRTSLPNGSTGRHVSPPLEDLDDGLSTLGIK